VRIDVSGLSPNRRAMHSATDATGRPPAQTVRESGGDSVTVSPRARLLAAGQAALQDAPEVRSSVVDEARARLRSGGAVYDGQSIARAMIETITENAT